MRQSKKKEQAKGTNTPWANKRTKQTAKYASACAPASNLSPLTEKQNVIHLTFFRVNLGEAEGTVRESRQVWFQESF